MFSKEERPNITRRKILSKIGKIEAGVFEVDSNSVSSGIDYLNSLRVSYGLDLIYMMARGEGADIYFGDDISEFILKSSYPFDIFDKKSVHTDRNIGPVDLLDLVEALMAAKDEVDIGAVCGRFQTLHYGHLEYILKAMARSKHLYIGITNPTLGTGLSEKQSQASNIDGHRLNLADNPLSYQERAEILDASLKSIGFKGHEYSIIPFPIEDESKIGELLPKGTTMFLTSYDAWGKEKLRRIEQSGTISACMLWERTSHEKPISGTLVRTKIQGDADWENYIPKAAQDYFRENRINDRIRLWTK